MKTTDNIRIIACIPVRGRRRLLARTITRLLTKNNIWKVVCAGHDQRDRAIAERFGAEWVHAENQPLGRKWNIAFYAAKQYDPDGILYVGSSDWITDNYIEAFLPYLKTHSLIGKPDFIMCDIRTLEDNSHLFRVGHWLGYPPTSTRVDEPIGGGRILTRKFLKEIDYRPFDESWDNSMDYSMWEKALKSKYPTKMLRGDGFYIMALSSNKWANKHNYDRDMNTPLAKEMPCDDGVAFLAKEFPEALTLFED
jgi:hypothetical protein